MKNINNENMSNSTNPNISNNFNSTNFNDLDGVPEGIPEKQPEQYQNVTNAHPYMGNLTSHQIGMMARTGQLGGEMVKRMIGNVEKDMAEGSVKPEELS